ncbi:hypothetical protein Tco_1202667, partial [Tanacetum coccineum]
VARCRPSVLVIVEVVWVVPRDGPIAVKTRSYGALALPEACLEICLEAWSLYFFACGVRWVKFPCFVILDFGSVLSVASHGWRQSVDTKVGRSLISLTLNELTVLCTILSKKVEDLQNGLKQTELTYGAAYTKLILRVKKLKHKVKASKSRRRNKIVVSDDEEVSEDPSK